MSYLFIKNLFQREYYALFLYRTSGVIFFIDYCTAIRDT
jgi:hypothetical protein